MQQNNVANAMEEPSGQSKRKAEEALDVVADHGGARTADQPRGDVIARRDQKAEREGGEEARPALGKG